jgi:RNA ligase
MARSLVMEPVHASTVVDLDEVDRLVASGYLSEQHHRELGYRILNYTTRTVVEHLWTDTTERCRGLVLDRNNNIVARPVRKFHNFTGVRPPGFVLTKSPLVYDKVDGSLGIVVPTPDGHIIATRGSFESDQARHATELWHRGYAHLVKPPRGITLLVEIVYPDNQIVVDYGTRDELVLLAGIDNRTGADVPLWEIEWPGAAATMHPSLQLDTAYSFATGNDKAEAEGVVLVWMHPDRESYRLKVKHPDYVRRHSTIFGLSSLSIWRRLAAGDLPDEIIAELPDELHAWARRQANAIIDERDRVRARATADLATIPLDANRADQARLINKNTADPPVVFKLLDGKDPTELLWKLVRPVYEPFRRESADDSA